MIKAMKSLKRDPAKIVEDELAMSSPSLIGRNEYPYGTRIRLGTDELKTLGCSIDDFKQGDLIHVFGMARVIMTRKETTNGKECNEVELQIEDMAIESEGAEKAPEGDDREPLSRRRARLYDRKKDEDEDEDE